MALLEELISLTAKENKDAVAIRDTHGDLTYEQLIDDANRFASCLGERNDRGFVALDALRGRESIVALTACIFAKRPFVFLDPRDSPQKNDFKLNLLGIRERFDGEQIIYRKPAAAPGTPISHTLYGVSNGEDIAYAVFTSGSTGEPKCVIVPRVGLAPMVSDHIARLNVGPGSRTLQFARLTFDGSISEILWTICSGATLVIPSQDDISPGEPLQATLIGAGITHLKTTPFALTVTEPDNEMSLKHVINGGGACRPNTVRKWSQVSAFHNAYGLSETSVCNLLSDDLTGRELSQGVPLGRPVGLGTITLNHRGSSEETCTRGELVIQGESVAFGYIAGGVFEPFPSGGDGRICHTGDIVDYRNGEYFYVERRDRQIKVRGYRIDPGEVERVACQVPGVKEAVFLRGGGGTESEDSTTLYWNGQAEIREIRTQLQERLETYKLPSRLVRIEEIPYTSNGKVDVDALRSMTRGVMPQEDRERTESETNLESALLSEITRLTGAPDITPADNFFDVGGDSMSSLELVTFLRERGWVDAGVKDVLTAPNIKVLVEKAEQGLEG